MGLTAGRTAILLLMAAGSAAAPAAAAGQTAVVQAGYGSDARRFSAGEEDRVFDGTAPTILLGGGAFVAPRWTIGLELDIGSDSSTTRGVTVTVGGNPTTVVTTFSMERRTVSALVGFHTPPDRPVAASVYGGLAFSSVRRVIGSDAGTGPPIPAPSLFLDRLAGPVAGVDVAVRVAPRLSLIAGVRAQGFALTGDLTGFSIRPFAGARVRF